MKALCFGSLNIDYTYRVDHFVARGETLLSQGLQVFSGGKGLNQSIALSRAGASVCHAGSIGTDGLFLLEELWQAVSSPIFQRPQGKFLQARDMAALRAYMALSTPPHAP